MLSISSTIRRGEAMASTLASNSRLSAASPPRFSSCVSTSVSNGCNREVKAAPRSLIFREPISRKVGKSDPERGARRRSHPHNLQPAIRSTAAAGRPAATGYCCPAGNRSSGAP